MKINNFLIVGASGLVGNYIYRFLKLKPSYKVLGTRFSQDKDSDLVFFDMCDRNSVSDFISSADPDVVIVPAAMPNVERCENAPEEGRAVNVDGIKNIVDTVKNTESQLVYFSTDYIFDGKDGPYSEEDTPNPLNEYGKQKLEMENYIKENLENYLIIRTTVVYGWESKGKNFIFGVMNRLGRNEEMHVPYDQINSSTYAGDLALAVYKLIKMEKKGIFNVVGDCVLSRYEFAIIAAKVLGLSPDKIKAFSTRDLGQKAKRPRVAGLKIDKLRSCGIDMSDSKEGLQKMMDVG